MQYIGQFSQPSLNGEFDLNVNMTFLEITVSKTSTVCSEGLKGRGEGENLNKAISVWIHTQLYMTINQINYDKSYTATSPKQAG